jgi:hypothetical protein
MSELTSRCFLAAKAAFFAATPPPTGFLGSAFGRDFIGVSSSVEAVA